MKTVLVLEGDPSNMQAFNAVLWLFGYSVLEATTGKEAIEAENCHGSIDLFLSDVEVPGPSGTDVALELTKSHPTVPVLFVSGTPMHSWRRSDLANFSNCRLTGWVSSKYRVGYRLFWRRLAN